MSSGNELQPCDRVLFCGEPDGEVDHFFGGEFFATWPSWACVICGEPETSPPLAVKRKAICWNCYQEIVVFEVKYQDWIRATRPTPTQEKEQRRPQISYSKRKRIFERDRYRCRYCESFKDLCLDHVLPFSQGGTSDDANLVTACAKCNNKKGSHLLKDTDLILLPEPRA